MSLPESATSSAVQRRSSFDNSSPIASVAGIDKGLRAHLLASPQLLKRGDSMQGTKEATDKYQKI